MTRHPHTTKSKPLLLRVPRFVLVTLPWKTNILAPENWWLEGLGAFGFGGQVWPIFRGELAVSSFRGLVLLFFFFKGFGTLGSFRGELAVSSFLLGGWFCFFPPHHPSVEGTSESSGKACSCWGRLVGELVGGGNVWKQWVRGSIDDKQKHFKTCREGRTCFF